MVKARSLNHHVMELAGMSTFDKLNNPDVILSSSEAEDLETAVQPIIKATSWMDWWTFAMKALALKSFSEVRLIKQLSLAGP